MTSRQQRRQMTYFFEDSDAVQMTPYMRVLAAADFATDVRSDSDYDLQHTYAWHFDNSKLWLITNDVARFPCTP